MILKWTETGELALCVPGTDIWVLTGIIRYGALEESGPFALLGRQIAQAPAMHELLKELEWNGDHTNWYCPWCLAYQEFDDNDVEIGSHKPDCRLAAVLKAVEGE